MEDFIASSSGWKSLENFDKINKKQSEEQKSKQFDINVLFAKTFSSPHGKKVLAYLEGLTTEKLTWDPTQVVNPVYNAFFREGENSLIKYIKARIKAAKLR